MAHKKKVRPAAAPAVLPAGADPAAQAEAALAAQRYKDAIEQFKDLLKRERRPVWLAGLAAAYAGRAEQLAAKGMVKEALALWRTRSEACQVPLLGGPYVGWLLKTGQAEVALALLPAVDKLPPEARDLARAQLAAAVLVAPDALLTGLSDESRGHRAAARAAIAACTCASPAALEPALQAISFRSPYRDLRPLLKALALWATDPVAAAASLARVSAPGPFEPLAQALRVCLMPGAAWLTGLGALDDAGRALVLELKGCPPPQRALVLDALARPGSGALAPPELFDWLLRHRRTLPEGLARRQALRLLVQMPQRQDAFRAAFGPLSDAEREHMLALAAELKQRPENAEPHWLRLVKLLGRQPGGPQRAALVLRRLADEHALHSPDGTLCDHAQEWLEQSLRLDSTDRESHLRLLRDARLQGDLKRARSGLDAARLQFPGDAPVLLEGVEIALASGAFKKAAALARQVLEADPINPRVRALIGQAHLSHARKLIGTRKLQAAQRELDEAGNWLRSTADRGRLGLLCGLAAEPAAAGDALLRQAVADLGGPLVGGFALLHEARRALPSLAFAPQELLRRAGVDITTTPSTTEVVALAQALHAVAGRDTTLAAALGVLSGMLQRAAATLDCSESEHLLICEALLRHGSDDLTRRYAAAALKRWPQRPVFVYLEAAARFSAEPWRMPQTEWQRLDRAFDQARDQGDERTATRLGKLLDAATSPGAGRSRGATFPRAVVPGSNVFDSVLDQLLEEGGLDRFLDLARQQLGKTTLDQLRREIPGSKLQFAQMLLGLLESAAEPDMPVPIPPRTPAKPKPLGPTPAAGKQWDFFDD